MLSKVRNFLDKKTLKLIYHGISENYFFGTYSIPVLFGHGILIPLRDFKFYKRNLYG